MGKWIEYSVFIYFGIISEQYSGLFVDCKNGSGGNCFSTWAHLNLSAAGDLCALSMCS